MARISEIPPWERKDQSTGGKYGYSGNLVPYGIREDVWKRAMDSFKEFESDPRIQNKSLLTLVDFRIEMTNSRLWVVNMDTKTVEMHGPVSHGVRSGSRTGAGEHFSNNTGSNQSSIGPFVTRGEYKSDLGGSLRRRP